jgi:glycosyltransferase involved in cell wall biosynthesis
MPTTIVLAADGCTDGTGELAAIALAEMSDDVRGAVIRVDRASAGGARDDACRAAIHRLGRPVDQVWLATTDADGTVPADWLLRQLVWAGRGADGVAGLVRVDRDAPRSLRSHARQLQRRLGAGPGHPHVYGANLGMRAGVWLEAGGFPHLRVGEDHAVWKAMRSAGADLVATPDVVVTTSGRLVGRAPDGFASVLARLAD